MNGTKEQNRGNLHTEHGRNISTYQKGVLTSNLHTEHGRNISTYQKGVLTSNLHTEHGRNISTYRKGVLTSNQDEACVRKHSTNNPPAKTTHLSKLQKVANSNRLVK
jgi:hypothetical protein